LSSNATPPASEKILRPNCDQQFRMWRTDVLDIRTVIVTRYHSTAAGGSHAAAFSALHPGGGACLRSGRRARRRYGWVVRAGQKASSIVICADAELRQQAIARNELFDAARAKLSPEAYKALTEDQTQWIKSYTARCGVAIDDPPPTLPIPQSVIACYRRESRARTAYLAATLSEPNPMASAQPSLPTVDQAFGPPATGPSPKLADQAGHNWADCTLTAVAALAGQPDSAASVATAAFGSYLTEQLAYQRSAALSDGQIDQLKRETAMARVLAQVMAVRAAREKLRQESPETRPAINYGRM